MIPLNILHKEQTRVQRCNKPATHKYIGMDLSASVVYHVVSPEVIPIRGLLCSATYRGDGYKKRNSLKVFCTLHSICYYLIC